MLRNLKHLHGRKLGALDGDLGHVKDFYFDDLSWMIRYVVVDTGTWLSKRLVLLSPHAFPSPLLSAQGDPSSPVKVQLTRRQIEDSPSIESHHPVSRQFEQDYFKYYGWPAYWAAAAGPIVVPPPIPFPHREPERGDDRHLLSTKDVTGYRVAATDSEVGSVSGFMVDGMTWILSEILVETGHWYAHKLLLLSPKNVARVSSANSTVFVNLTTDDLRVAAQDEAAKAVAAVH